MMRRVHNEHGFALVYGLVVLLIASVAGTGMLFMSRKSSAGASEYAKVRMASLAASAALKACEGQFLDDAVTAFAILKKYDEDDSFKWLLGDATGADSEQRIKMWDSSAGSPEYSAKIISWDRENHYLTIEGTGYVPRGGKKRALAVYELSGIGEVTAPTPNYALYLGSYIQNLNCPFNIQGDMYISLGGVSGEQHVNGGSGGTVNGNLKVDSYSTNMLDLSGAVTVTGNALVLGRLKLQGPFTINGKAGFTNDIPVFNSTIQIGDDAFFSQTGDFGRTDGVVGLPTKTVTYNSAISSDRFKNFHKIPATMTDEEVAAAVDMTTDPAEPYTVDIGVIPASKIMDTAVSSLTGSTVESWWANQQAAGNLFCGEWLVVRLSGNPNVNGGYFTRKVIIMVSSMNVNGNWYDCSDESNTMIYISGENGQPGGIGVPSGKQFRGFIYCDNRWGATYQFGTGSIVYGAIQHKRGMFNINNGVLNMDFREGSPGKSALQELKDCGVVGEPGGGAPVTTGEMVLTDLKIRPKLLAKQM